jgi:hypothetical protein
MRVNLIIASNRQLPIRYDAAHKIWFNRGIHPPHEVQLPFFVEVTCHTVTEGLIHYIEQQIIQYKKFEIEVYCETKSVLSYCKKHFPHGRVIGNRIIL